MNMNPFLINAVKGQPEAPNMDYGSFFYYMLKNKPNVVKSSLVARGYMTLSTEADMYRGLVIQAASDKSLIRELVENHPDYELIIEDYESKQNSKKQTTKTQKTDQQPSILSIPENMNMESKWINLLVFIVLVALVLKIFKN